MNVMVGLAGGAIAIAEAGIIGWLTHRWLLAHAPGLAAWIPRDGGAVLGLLAGAATVARWAVG